MNSLISLLWVSCWNRFMRPSHSVSFVNFLSSECERMSNRSCSDWSSQIEGLFCYLVIILPRWHWWEFCSMWQKRERKAALKRSKSAPHVLEAELVFCSVNPSGSPEILVYAKIRNDNCDARRSTFPGVEPGLVCSLRATGAKLRTCTNPLHDNEVTSPKSCGELSCHERFRVDMNWNAKWCYSFFNQGVKIRVMSFFSRLENCTNIALVGDGTIIESNQFIFNRDRARSVECDCEFPDFMFFSVH